MWGFKEEQIIQADTPIAAKSALRIVISIAANKKSGQWMLDVKAANKSNQKNWNAR